jgi:ABC-type transport system involved in multi-copper enzyme maturation permease subunit
MKGAITSEIRKIFTTKLWWGMGIGMAIFAFLLSMGAAALVGLTGPDGQSSGFDAMNGATGQIVYSAGLLGEFGSMTALFPLALGVLLITTEYRHKTATATYLATPRRWIVAVSKVIAVIAVGAVLGVIHVISSVAGGALVLTVFKDQPLLLTNGDVLASFGTSIVATIVWALIGFGFGMLVRNQIAAVLIAVAFGFLGQFILNIAFAVLGWSTAAKFIPGNLTTGMLVTGDPTGGAAVAGESPYFAWWLCALLLVAYAAVLTVAGSILSNRKDIS